MAAESPDHIENTVQQMADLHGDHVKRATPLQRAAEALTKLISRPVAVIVMLALVAAWVAFNLMAEGLGLPQFDPPPFQYLELTVGVLALGATILILSSQRRADTAAIHRSQLTLQLASLSEQKVAKVIALLEEQRRENPALSNRPDAQAKEMSVASDPKLVLDRIIDTHEEAEHN